MLKPVLLLAIGGVFFVSDACADVYKCRKGGVIAYQDRPCPAGTGLGRVVMEAPTPVGKTASSSLRPPTPVPNTPPAPPAPPQLPAAENYKCTRYDGTSYFSASLMPKRYYVPAWSLTPPRSDLPAGSKVWVTDQCVSAPIKDACDHYNVQMDDVQRKTRSAQASEKAALEREFKRLRTIANSRCARR